jgi:RNA polymerase sigma factor (sigma-70 family)
VQQAWEPHLDHSTSTTPSPELHVLAESAGWEEVYREHVGPVYRYCYARTGNRADAEDITAQVFLRALPRLRLRAAPAEIRSYLMATSRSMLAEHWTLHYGCELGLEEREIAQPEAAVEVAGADAGVSRAARVLAALPEHYRRILELRFLRGYSVRETAKEMDITVANAKVLQHRALRRAAQEELP